MSSSRRKKMEHQRKQDRRHKRLASVRPPFELPRGSFPTPITAPAGRLRMSEVLEDFVEPYRQFAPGLEAYRKLLMMAIVAWNLALLPEAERDESLGNLMGELNDLTAADRADMRRMIGEMVARKEAVFPSIRRTIISFEVEDRGDDFHLTVASTLEEIPPPP
jgi:hypothetical protein